MTGSRQTDSCYLAAIRLLTGRDYTALVLKRKLEQRKFLVDDVNAVVERLNREGYLQDRRYAERFIMAARENGCFVGYRLQQELRRRGVPLELISELMQGAPEDGDEQLEHARELIVRRYSRFNPLTSDERERRRIAGFLQRRGYGTELICRLLQGGSSPVW